jgi:hypothetical protein
MIVPSYIRDLLTELSISHYLLYVLSDNHYLQDMLMFLCRYLIASHTTDYQHPMLFLNTIAVTVLVVAKLPNMHKVRIFGINAGN